MTTHLSSSDPTPSDSSNGNVAHVSSLLNQLRTSATPTDATSEHVYESSLIQARLGVGSSLFTALQHKHRDSASHCLRVALECSSWAVSLGLKFPVLDEIEVAGLLHDIGKIGVPDRLLEKPSKLTDEERMLINTHRLLGIEIIKSFGASQSICDIVRFAPAWYRSEQPTDLPSGEAIPLGARMLAIVDAFDSMTHDQVYRQAMSRSAASAAIQAHAGTQFDPNLARHFNEIQSRDQGEVHMPVAERWLQQLTTPTGSANWHPVLSAGVSAAADSLAPLFLDKLIESMRDGVIFVDQDLKIQLWNRGAKRLTGISCEDVVGEFWRPSLIHLRDENGISVSDDECPVRHVMETSVQSIRRLQVTARDGRLVVIDIHIVPVVGPDGSTHGVNLLIHDASSETSLEERVQTLHEKATKDALTKVSNRAEFDRAHSRFIDAHANRGALGSLIICDIDHFKRVNDTFGHPAGDQALKFFAKLLEGNCRKGDLVARYGGEEFVMLCADCNANEAEKRAESIREQLRQMHLPMLGGKAITASFGVTETLLQDTDAEMLHRADAALLSAKQGGRDRVVKIGLSGERKQKGEESRWLSWWKSEPAEPVLQREIMTSQQMKITCEKLRGFITDHNTTVSLHGRNCLALKFHEQGSSQSRRGSDRPMSWIVELELAERRILESESTRRIGQAETRIQVSIKPLRNRDRRRGDTTERAEIVFNEVKSYLMASESEHRNEQEKTIYSSTLLDPTWLGLTAPKCSR